VSTFINTAVLMPCRMKQVCVLAAQKFQSVAHVIQATEAARAAAAGPASRAEADAVAAVLDTRPRGHGVWSTRSFDNSGSPAAAGLSNRHSEPLPPLPLRGLVSGGPAADGSPSRDAAGLPDSYVATRQGSTCLPLAAQDSRSGGHPNGPVPDAVRPGEDRVAAADEESSTEGDAAARGSSSSPRPRVAQEPQRLLVLGGMGARGDNGWFAHVVDHVASLRQPGTGDGAAVVCTMDYRWAHGICPDARAAQYPVFTNRVCAGRQLIWCCFRDRALFQLVDGTS